MFANRRSAHLHSMALRSLLLLVAPLTALGITTIHYDKPDSSKLTITPGLHELTTETPTTLTTTTTTTTTKPPPTPFNATLLPSNERHKRLLPYINFYLAHRFNRPIKLPTQYSQPLTSTHQSTPSPSTYAIYPLNNRYTPFLESNALPGPFLPMRNPLPQDYSSEDKSPDYGAIYEKLSQLKAQQQQQQQQQQSLPYQTTRYVTKKVPVHYLPVKQYVNEPQNTVIHTYTPTSIDVDGPATVQHATVPPPAARPTSYPAQQPIHYIPYHTQSHNQFLQEVLPNRKPFILLAPKPHHTETSSVIQKRPPLVRVAKPIIFVQTKPNYYATERPPKYKPVQFQLIAPAPSHTPVNHNLNAVLQQLQQTNALPQTFTPDNIDNSIKTLVEILNAGKAKPKPRPLKPIVVADADDDDYDEDGNENKSAMSTPEGGTPGKAGIDYPQLASIPPTKFNCKKQRYKGFFADPDTNCQVWHYCDLNGGQASFLCPNGTIFSQVALTCDWWFNVKCSSTTQLYVLNERLYKYIIPLTPKFPEDYSGPLVDKYLTMKFKEMEEKLQREKEEKANRGEEEDDEDDDDDEEDELQLLERKSTTVQPIVTTQSSKN